MFSTNNITILFFLHRLCFAGDAGLLGCSTGANNNITASDTSNSQTENIGFISSGKQKINIKNIKYVLINIILQFK